jgi:hypothetical protein
MSIYLEDEQLALFEQLLEAWRAIPRDQRSPFLNVRMMGANIVQGNGINQEVYRRRHRGPLRRRPPQFRRRLLHDHGAICGDISGVEEIARGASRGRREHPPALPRL